MNPLAILNGRLIDPAAGVDGAKDILLKDGKVAEIASPGKAEAGRRRADARRFRPRGRARTYRHSRSSARTGPGLQGDDRDRNRGRRGRRIYRRGRHAQHRAGERYARDYALDAGAGTRRGGARFSHRSGHPRVERRSHQRFRRAQGGRRGCCHRRWPPHPERLHHARNSGRRGAGGTERHPARGRHAHDQRRGHERRTGGIPARPARHARRKPNPAWWSATSAL